MKSQDLYTVWCYISGEEAEEICPNSGKWKGSRQRVAFKLDSTTLTPNQSLQSVETYR